MKAKKYLSKEDVKNFGEDYCNMFYCKDENGFFDTIWIESEKQKNIRLKKEAIESEIKKIEFQLKYLKNEYSILQSEYDEEDNQFINQ